MAYCNRCERRFPHDRALQQHKGDSSRHWTCYKCHLDFDFASTTEQFQHLRESHHFCRACNFYFNTAGERIQHMANSHLYCRLHDMAFTSQAGLRSHCIQSPGHHACQNCKEPFDTYAELQAHDRDVHTYCTECQRSFQSESNLRHHLNSKQHRPANVRCPGHGCNRAFVSHAALVLHFESGTCPSRMTREELNRLVVRADTNNYITNPSRLLTGPLGRSEPPATTVTWATERSWNGFAFQCFLCNRTFDTLARLNQHLQSPVHQDRIYRCPKSDCRTEFVALSGLCQHVEGGSCGVRMFRQVRDVMDGLTMGFHALTM